jgi:putative ABC transport system permease protein
VFLDLRIDGRLIAFLVGASTVTTVLFGLVPALRASGVAPIGAAGSAAGRVSARAGLLEPLVAVEVAVSVTVLFVAGLMLLSFGKLLRVDPGFDKDGVLLAVISASPSPSAPLEPSQGPMLQAQLLNRIRSLPGVQGASVSAWPMFIDGGWTNGVRIPGRPPNDADAVIHLAVSPGFIATMRMRLLEGRELQTGDRETPLGSPVVVNQAFARRYFGRERVVGERYLRPGNGQVIGQEIVGVVADARYNNLREPAPPTVFVPLDGLGTLQVRTAGDPLALTASVRREVRAVHPAFWVSSVSLQSSLVDNALLRERLLAVLSAFFGGIGLLLAAVGLYGVLSYAVVQRTREIGIRLALGAPRAAVVRAMLARVGAMTAIGIVVGIGGGLFLARFVRAWLFEVQPLDVWSVMLPIVALLTAGLVAALRPARRASRVDPVIALRAE